MCIGSDCSHCEEVLCYHSGDFFFFLLIQGPGIDQAAVKSFTLSLFLMSYFFCVIDDQKHV